MPVEKEIEVKILGINVPEIIEKIEQLGGKKVFEGNLHTMYFDFPQETTSLKNHHRSLRIRNTGDSIKMTLKEFQDDNTIAAEALEHTVSIDDLPMMQAILEKLGLEVVKVRPKHRISYRIPNTDIAFDIDTLPGIPTYMEVEVPDEYVLEKIVMALGYTMEDTKTLTQTEVEDYYNKPRT